MAPRRRTKDPVAPVSTLGALTQGLDLNGMQVVNKDAVLLEVALTHQASPLSSSHGKQVSSVSIPLLLLLALELHPFPSPSMRLLGTLQFLEFIVSIIDI